MQQVVYVDILFALNLIICFFLISAVKRLLRESACAWRVLVGAALGGVYSLAIFLPEMTAYISLPVRTAFFALISFCVFGFGSVRRFLRCWAAMAGVNFLFAGATIGVWFLFKPSSLALKNGAVYFNIGFLPLVLCAAACYALLRLFGRFLSRRNSENAECEVEIENLGRTVSAAGVIDTGNTLTDSFTGKKVSVVSQRIALLLLPENCEKAILDPLSLPLPEGVHLIPTSTVNGEGLMAVFCVQRIKITTAEKAFTLENAAIAVSEKSCFAGGSEVLLNADIMFGAKTERYGGKANEKKVERKAEYAADSAKTAQHRNSLHKRAGNAASPAERGAGAGDNAANLGGR